MQIINIDIGTLEDIVHGLASADLSEDAVNTLADFLLDYDRLDCRKLVDIVSNAREFGDITELYEFFTRQTPQTTSKRQLIDEVEKEFGVVIMDTGVSMLAIE